MGTFSYAQTELDILVKSSPDPDNRPIIEEFIPEILALIKKFGESGQSGGSAPYTANALSSIIKKLCLYEPICPITGIDEEWTDVSSINDGKSWYQNKRCSSLFKDGKEGRAYYCDAIVKRTQDGSCWSGWFWLSEEDYLKNNEKAHISNNAYIKSFPFIPKTFYIDVIEKEVAKDDWEMWCKDPKQLEEVWEYYDKKINKF